jgi:hypothetical protein
MSLLGLRQFPMAIRARGQLRVIVRTSGYVMLFEAGPVGFAASAAWVVRAEAF